MKAKFVNESLISDIDIDQIVNNEFIKKLLIKGDYILELYIEQYKYENDLDIENDDDFFTSIEFKEYLETKLKEKAEDILDIISNHVKNQGNIEIWRSLKVNDNWLNNINSAQRLGIYWTYDEKFAEPHWGYNNSEKE